jgi:hypothetical protein
MPKLQLSYFYRYKEIFIIFIIYINIMSISKDFIGGFFVGSGLTGICLGIYLMYLGKKFNKEFKEFITINNNTSDID